MYGLCERLIDCPYCGESITVLIEALDEAQEYIEDCQVCCRPIVFYVTPSPSGEPELVVHTENDSY